MRTKSDPYADHYWLDLCNDNLALAAAFIRSKQWLQAIQCLRAGIRLANRAHALRRAGRCCAAIKRLYWLMDRVPAAPAQPQWMEAA